MWGQARAAGEVIRQADAAWFALAQATRFVAATSLYAVQRIADAMPQQWADIADLRRPKVDAWTAVRAGLSLSLADAAGYRRRVHSIQEAETRALQQREQDAREWMTGRRVSVAR